MQLVSPNQGKALWPQKLDPTWELSSLSLDSLGMDAKVIAMAIIIVVINITTMVVTNITAMVVIKMRRMQER